jgi:hypothetical protein
MLEAKPAKNALEELTGQNVNLDISNAAMMKILATRDLSLGGLNLGRLRCRVLPGTNGAMPKSIAFTI